MSNNDDVQKIFYPSYCSNERMRLSRPQKNAGHCPAFDMIQNSIALLIQKRESVCSFSNVHLTRWQPPSSHAANS